ncbi:pyridoxal phosphate-dependent decarboxylase family protein [Terrimonas pollutisoli]|uniref:pyridoxal phosphate-dependent decarboxylase family protein n=1 Tax=Terrimonas pollutisoli TaxID=3034147 RepID=UPI0023ED3A28|nr:aminotransferase class V-fold PLP-dependent enzyme [Terrimonas sp. H1YJ31]
MQTLPVTTVNRQAIINMPAEEFRTIGHALIDQLADFLEQLPGKKVTKGLTPSEVRKSMGADNHLPENGSDAATLAQQATSLLTDHSLFNGHPKFLGYITSSPAPLGAMADFIASLTNPNCGAFILSPVATEIELQCIRWLSELIGYQKGCGGVLVSGGNMANIVAIWAARKNMAQWNIREEGLTEKGLKFTLYATQQVHTWLHKTADLFGLGLQAIRWIAMDDSQRMDVQALDKQIQEDKAAGFIPLAVVGTAGSVGFGTTDPLAGIAAICKKHNTWFHVDGAYGGLAAALPELQEMFEGLKDADSIAIDPHKWLYCPLEAGCTLVRDPNLLADAFSFHPAYYQFDKVGDETPVNFYEFGPQNSRGFRALKVWMVMQQAGRNGITEMIRDDIALSKQLFNELKKQKNIEVYTDDLSITTFRYTPDNAPSNEQEKEEWLTRLNTALLNNLQKNGELFVSNAMLDGKYLLRSCIVNFRTSLEDIKGIPKIIVRYGQEAEKELKG